MINTYKTQTLIDGFKINKQFLGKKLVAIPIKYLNGSRLIVTFGKEAMELAGEPLHTETFEDKYGRGKTYTLGYFEWKPVRITW